MTFTAEILDEKLRVRLPGRASRGRIRPMKPWSSSKTVTAEMQQSAKGSSRASADRMSTSPRSAAMKMLESISVPTGRRETRPWRGIRGHRLRCHRRSQDPA